MIILFRHFGAGGKVNKVWTSAIITVIILTSTSIQRGVLAAAPTTTTKTFQDFGLGFKIEYSSNLVLNKSSDNITAQYRSGSYDPEIGGESVK